ncbi:MAG: hypothetical protein HUK15_03585, partial [Bacteroidales bacterium]|nr:hypothetical protein [Bacteroidales bacterium]
IMRFSRIFAILFLVLCPIFSYTQVNSWDGWQVKPRGDVRMLNFFVNIIYDVNPEKEANFAKVNAWNTAKIEGINDNLPSYLKSLMDTEYNPDNLYGCITRLYGESSFDELRIVGDFVVVNIKESRVLQLGAFSQYNIERAAVRFVNEMGGLQTVYGHNSIDYYDFEHKGEIGFVEFFFRNITKAYGGDDAGSGYFSSSMLQGEKLLVGGDYYPFSGKGTAQCVGTRDASLNPSGIVQHEISHSFFGSNAFHTSGGNHRRSGEYMPFLAVQGGFGLMGGANSGLVSCNGYERLRMHWLHDSNKNSENWWIVARDLSGNLVNADIDKNSGNVSFVLRDFVTYGDAIRIKLPYKDSEKASNQYIWIENHQSGKNNKFDFLQYSTDSDCRPREVAGIYAYYQVGRDVLSGSYSEVYQSDERDNLRIIPAEGYWNYSMKHTDSAYNMRCITWNNHYDYYIRETENPFCGTHDQEHLFFPEENDNVLTTACEKTMSRKIIGNQVIDSLVSNGDARDVFCTHTRINMGTNPSTCNTRTYYTSLTPSKCQYAKHSQRNNPTIFLSGLGIEFVPLTSGNFRVNIRWDDYDITNSAIWTGKIVLREKAVLQPNNHIELAQNLTPIQAVRDSSTNLFSCATTLTCESGSEFVLMPKSEMLVNEASTLIIESDATFRLEPKSSLKIDKKSALVLGGKLVVGDGAQLIIKSKDGLVDVGGRIIVEGKGKVKMWGHL